MGKLSLLGKINFIVALVFLLVTVIETTLSVKYEKEQFLKIAKEQVTDLTTMYFDSLNTMMLTGTMHERAILRGKLLARNQILDARVIRGNPVKQQFGEGFPEEQPVDELDRLGLKGESSIVVNVGEKGRELTVVTPFRATENTRGVNCLQCHNVPSGAINGAIRVTYSLAQMDSDIATETFRNIITNILLFAIGLAVVSIVLHRWLINPINYLMTTVQKRARGDTTARVRITNYDEIGRLGEAFNTMAENVNATTEREHLAAENLQQKVDSLQSVMRKVSKGDFSIKVGFDGDGAIGQLAADLQVMIDYLKDSIDEKNHAVETLKNKVDELLNVTNAVSNGNLTCKIHVEGDDAIAQLANGIQGMIENLNTLVTQIKASGRLVSSSSVDLSQCMQKIESTSQRQANTTDNLSSTALQISDTSHQLVKAMDEIIQMANSATSSAIQSHVGLNKLQKLMEKVIQSSSLIAEKLEILDERAQNINSVVTTISKVADQTNLLSLNAAIEADKAGEYGRGFALVATEIRRLADQAAISSLEIEQMINEMQDSVSNGVEAMKGFTHQVKNSVKEVKDVSEEQSEIIQKVQTMSPRFEGLHKSMQNQSNSADRISVAMQQLNKESQYTMESLEKSAHTFTILTDSANTLQDSIQKFKIENNSASDE